MRSIARVLLILALLACAAARASDLNASYSPTLHPVSWTHLLRTRELLELDRRMVPEARMQPPNVVEPIDVASQYSDELTVAANLAPVQKLSLERVEEALHVGVVLWGIGTVHARDDRVSL